MSKIISASRRVDLVSTYPDRFIDILERKVPPSKTHTIVIWTKNPINLIYHRDLRKTLEKYSQIFLLLSITGMGGSIFERGIPEKEEIFSILPELIKLLKSPDRINIRFDPMVKFKIKGEEIFTNYTIFPEIVDECKKHGIKTFITSFLDIYPKVKRNLEKFDISPIPFDNSEKKEISTYLLKIAEEKEIEISWCCERDFPSRGCISGELLNSLHPLNKLASVEKAKGQRELCKCTKSWDIGWYYPCSGKCLYCYANPDI